MKEKVELKGMQDPRLEAKNRTTPTKPEDIGPRARAYIRLRDTAVVNTLILQGSHSPDTAAFHQRAQEALATVRDEIRRWGFNQDGFDWAVEERIHRMREEEREEESDRKFSETLTEVLRERRQRIAGDWDTIVREFPNQYDKSLGK